MSDPHLVALLVEVRDECLSESHISEDLFDRVEVAIGAGDGPPMSLIDRFWLDPLARRLVGALCLVAAGMILALNLNLN